MKKILTIDFSIIMTPNINKYQENFPNIKWDELNPNLLHPNYPLYHSITMWIINQIKNMQINQVLLLAHQEDILSYLDENEHYTIINVDHSHDMGYGAEQEQLHNYNWVEHLNYTGKLDSYLWIYDDTSDKNIYNNFPCQSCNIRKKYILDKFTDIDMLVLCFSPELTPPQVHQLYHLWCSICINHFGEFIEIK